MAENKAIRIADIHRVAELQARDGIEEHHVEDMVTAIKKKKKLPRVKCIRIDDPEDTAHHDKIYAYDSHHTIEALIELKKSTCPVAMRRGTWQDARDLASAANQEHLGLKRSGSAKRRAVTMALEDHPDWSDTVIAGHTGTSPDLVADVRPSVPVAAEAKTRLGADGKTRTVPTNGKPRSEKATSTQPELPDMDPAAVRKYFRGEDGAEPHAYEELLKAVVALATKVSQAVNDAEPDSALRQYLLNCGFVWSRDKTVGDKHLGWQCVGLRGLYRVIRMAGMPGNKNKQQVLAAYEAANRGE